MPTYEYYCQKCKNSFEAFQSMRDDAFKTCPQNLCCRKTWGRGAVVRQLGTGAGLIFKGSGFYITDYRSEGYKAAARGDKPAGDKPSGSGGDSPKKQGGKGSSSKE